MIRFDIKLELIPNNLLHEAGMVWKRDRTVFWLLTRDQTFPNLADKI